MEDDKSGLAWPLGGEGDDIIQNKLQINECACSVECWLVQHFESQKIIFP